MIKAKQKKAQAGPVVAGALKSFVERIEKLEEERGAIGSDVRDVYSEAKGVGYDAPTIRRTVAWRKLDAADRAERESLDAVYRHALGMACEMVSNGDVSLRQAEEITGVSKSSIQRALAVPEVSQVEMHADDLGTVDAASTPPREMVADDLGDPLWVVDKDRAKFREQVKRISATVKLRPEVGPVAPPSEGTPIDLTIPAALDRKITPRVPA